MKRVAENLHTDATAAITQQQVEGADLQDEAFSGRCVRAGWHKWCILSGQCGSPIIMGSLDGKDGFCQT